MPNHTSIKLNTNGYSSLCNIYELWVSIRVFLSKCIFRHGYYYGHFMDTSTRGTKPGQANLSKQKKKKQDVFVSYSEEKKTRKMVCENRSYLCLNKPLVETCQNLSYFITTIFTVISDISQTSSA